MQPFFNSQLYNQAQSGGSAPINPQVFSMQMQPSMGLVNPQIAIPFNSNGQTMPNMPLLTPQQASFVNALSHLVMPQMGHGFSIQNHVRNLSNAPMFANQMNPCQAQGQVFAPNLSTFPQQFNQNMCFPNQNPMQNMNPDVPLQMLNPSRVLPFNVPVNSHQALGHGNSNSCVNMLSGAGMQLNPNQQDVGMPTTDANASRQLLTAAQQVHGSSSAQQQTQTSHSSPFVKQQGNRVQNVRSGSSNPNWKNSPGKDFRRNQQRYQKSHNHHMGNGKRMFGSSKEQKRKEHGNHKATKFAQIDPNPTNQNMEKKRTFALTYTEKEIKQWREERQKNFPSKANIEKKQIERLSGSKVIDKEAKLRREQLKEILAKQAELGVEVAELPSHYLSDSEKQVCGQENNRPFTKKGRFQNNDRRGRYKKNDQFVKRQKMAENDSSSISSLNKRNETLLHKLLSADIRRDKNRLLQVFRFMILNSFFMDWPEKPLKFPLVEVKEGGCEDEMVVAKSSLVGKDVFEVNRKISANVNNDDEADGNHDNDNEDDTQIKRATCFELGRSRLTVKAGRVEEEEEEGEIID